MKIVSFNIWDLPLWFVKNRRQRMEKIVMYLRGLDADIICLQESWDGEHRALIHEGVGRSQYHATTYKGQGNHFGKFMNATGGLFTLSRWPLTDQTFIPFSSFNYSISEIVGRKGALASTISTPYGSLRVFNTHLHRPQRALGQFLRLRQLRHILKHADRTPKLPTILAGDLNEDKITLKERFARLLSEKKFTHPVESPHDGTAPTYRKENPLVQLWINRLKHSQRIDYILTRSLDTIGLQVHSYKPEYIQPELSDHDPVMLVMAPLP